ncbi:DUF418 domain-containing protein [Sphingomonas ginkgonis]|uniref:DUF418 domain-containing protein n=1 Tax=Sphingomonas ginkgonis TaxID=2315330 RepID=A0A3R9WPL2_9SPHN|nr:DUF418 domain-containing protein [Sphingomonas ginkgonis]RST30331.1 DUF418 domain-containing protein [Sphingomonas ginkgonis]
MNSSNDSGRIRSLDVIRGIAVMGIFSVNVVAFAMIDSAYFNPSAYGGASGASLFVWVANMLVIDGKMRSLFSMLFGASALLVIEKAEAAGLNGRAVHLRRMAVLLGFGLVHYYLIWFGDILTLYAVSGLVAFLFRRRPSYKLVILGSLFIAANMAFFAMFLAGQYQAELAAHAPHASRHALEVWNDGMGSLEPSASDIARDRALHLGSWTGFAAHNLARWGSVIGNTVIFIPETIGLMLIGMAAYRSGFLTGAWSDVQYRRAVGWGIGVGVVGSGAVAVADLVSGFDPIVLVGALVVVATPLITLQALGYAALIILLSRRGGAWWDRVAAAGRAAFSNYLGTSILASLIFYGWGLGLYGSVERWQAWLLAPLFWLVMLAWSKPWLERYRYGPLEWLWRSLSRGHLQPMRKPSAPRVAREGTA